MKKQNRKTKQSGQKPTAASSGLKLKYVVTHQGVGIDVSKDHLDVCISFVDGGRVIRVIATKKFKNTPLGFKSLIAFVNKKCNQDLPLCFVLEATGTYHENVAYYLHGLDYKVCIELPNKIEKFAKSLNSKSKTDKADAQIMAHYALERNPKAWVPGNRNLLIMRQLSREKDSIQEMTTMLMNQIHAIKNSHEPNMEIIKRKQDTIKTLNKQIKAVEESINKVIASDAEIKKDVERLCTIRGVGKITAVQVLAETGGFELIENKAQLVSYAGYDVVSNQSGTSVNGKSRISKKGNSHIRKSMFFPAMVAVKAPGEMQDLYKRVLERNPKLKMKALVGVQRKLLVLMYTLVRTESDYDAKFAEKKAEQGLNKTAEQAQETLPAA